MAQQQGGMFGPTPQELQMGLMEQQQLADQQAAQQWGRQSLGQQINTSAYGSALSFGRGLQNLGQATGVLPQDPRLDEARRMMGIKKEIMDSGIDPQNIDEFYPALIKKMMSGGMVDKATALQRDYQNLSNTQDAIQVRRDAAAVKKREEAMPGLGILKNLAASLKDDPSNAGTLAEYEASITPEKPRGDINLLSRLTKIAKAKASGKDAKIGVDVVTDEAVFHSNDPDEPGTYRMVKGPDGKMVKEFGQFKVRPENNISLTQGGANINTLDKVAGIEARYLSLVKPHMVKVTAVDEAMSQFQLAGGGNSAAEQAFKQAFASVFKSDGQMSKAEIEKLVNSGSIPVQLTNTVKTWLLGTGTQLSRDEKLAAMSALRQAAADKVKNIETLWRTSAKDNGVKDSDIELIVSGSSAARQSPSVEAPADRATRLLKERGDK